MAKTNNQPKEGAKVKLGGSLGTYVFTGGKWRHKSGDGYDFAANPTNAAELNKKYAAGDYEIWDNDKGGYVKGQPVARTQEEIDKGGEFRLGLQKDNKTQTEEGADGKTWRDYYDEIMPKEDPVTKKPVSTVTQKKTPDQVQREVLPETQLANGVTKIGGAIGKLTGDEQPLAPQSEFYDPESYKAGMVEPKNGVAGLFGNVNGSELLGYIPDVIRGVTGLIGASEKVPEYSVPQEWTDHVQNLKEKSEFGIDDATTGEFNRQLDRTYASDVNSIRNLSGGSAGIALGNLNRASYNRNEGANQFAMADQAAKERNLDKYGNALGTNLDLSRMIFGDKYNLAMMNKTAGAQLAADALSDISNRGQFNATYGKGTAYDDLQKTQVESAKYLKDIYKDLSVNPMDLSGFNPAIIGLDPNYFANPLLYGKQTGN